MRKNEVFIVKGERMDFLRYTQVLRAYKVTIEGHLARKHIQSSKKMEVAV